MIQGFDPINYTLQSYGTKTTLSGPDNNTSSNPSVIVRNARQFTASGISQNFGQEIMKQQYDSKSGIGVKVDIKI